jgi:uncharacterized protein with NAD-binding domain and iron-sulfur cluster
MSNNPNYLYPAGSVMMHSPLMLENSDMYGYFAKGDLTKLQTSIDGTLNVTAGGKLNFQVISPYVLLTFTNVGHAYSQNPVDQAKGWIQETDIITWVMVGQIAANGKLERIFFYPFHIFVNDTMALINGRELFGYPKYDCQYTMPGVNSSQTDCSLTVKGFQPFSSSTEIAWQPLLEVNAVTNNRPHKVINGGWLEFLEEVFAILKSMPDFLNMDVAGWEDVISMLFVPRVDQIFLKQFPDSAGMKAVYQSILVAPAMVDKIHSVKLLGDDYTLNLHQVASFPLADSLGLTLGTQNVLLPFNLNFDFSVPPGEVLADNSSLPPQKVAILGGGVGSMTTAYYLSSQPGWQERYDLTVYQMGWRLGGKGASGRNAAFGQRIEEHGLHIWFGFYDNAFAMLREAYDTLQRPAGAPLATWQDAFKPQDYIVLTELMNEQWKIWNLEFPHIPGTPGDGTEKLSMFDSAEALLAWVRGWIHDAHRLSATKPPVSSAAHENWLQRLASTIKRDVEELIVDARAVIDGLEGVFKNLKDHKDHSMISAALKSVKKWLLHLIDQKLEDNDELRRVFICADLGITVLIGMLEDGVFEHGFDVINNIDFRDWLTKYGANVQFSVDSAPVRGFYDLVFAFEGGDLTKPNIEAGTLLRAMMLIGIAYKGSIMFKMQAGMGDTIFSPMYQVLKERGVKFKFFHKVEELIPDETGIAQIRMTEQVQISSGNAQYQPFVYVNGLACWGNQPNYDQILPAQAALLQANNINLESSWSNWAAVYQTAFGSPLPSVTLERGKDFDLVVFGISKGSLTSLCPQLLTKSPAMNTMNNAVQTVATQAYQVWLTKNLADLGWTNQPNGQEPVLSGYTEPFDTWAAMDQLLVREDWKAGAQNPKNVSYFCSVLPISSFPPFNDYGFPAKMSEIVKQGAINQLEQHMQALMPNAVIVDGFHWDWLTDTSAATGKTRFDSQYWRANIDPSEQYVMSVVDSTAQRLETDGSGFANLYLTGDWIKTNINAGCVEAAVMAGMQTSRAISGFPKVIQGEKDF